jgi:hypothetical protein
MRYGVISDVHANLHALDAALDFLSTQVVNRICAQEISWDTARCRTSAFQRVRDLDAACVAGNHDLIALGRLSDERCIPLARASLRWTHAVLDEGSRAFLESLPLRATTSDAAVAHGSPRGSSGLCPHGRAGPVLPA